MDYTSLLKFWLWDFRILAFYSMALLLLSVIVLILMAKFLNGQVTYFTEYINLSGYVIVLTGGLEGIGRAAARDFVKRGARLIIGCDDMEKGEAFAAELTRDSNSTESSKGAVVTIPLDLSSMDSVRKFCSHVLNQEKKINILCLTHGISAPRRKELTDANFEKTMATNYFGQFLLTILLFKLIKGTPGSRIITSVSRIYTFLRNINPLDLNFESERYTSVRAASLSMLCLVLFSRHFARLASKYNVRVNCFCPGFISTSNYDNNSDIISNRMRKWAGYLVGRTAHQGCQTLLFLAMADEDLVGSGGMFSDCKSVEYEGAASCEELAQTVYEETEKILKLSEVERKIL